jgi:hypothetical protein
MSNNNVCSHTGRLKLPYILQAQAQKEVTHNQALNILDALVNTVAQSITDTPPGNSTEGDIYIIGDNPQGIFDGNANNLAVVSEGSWTFYKPLNYMEVMVIDESQKFTFADNEWLPSNTENHKSDQANSDNKTNEFLKIEHWQEDLNLLGKVAASTNVIPHHSLVIAVNVWVIEEITGAPSFAVGVKDDPSRYGDKLKANKDTTNIGMTYHPVTYYYDTPVTIVPNQMEFTGGVIRVSVQYINPKGSWGW